MKKPIKIKSVKSKPKIRSGMTNDALHKFYFDQLNEQERVKKLMTRLTDL